MPEPRYYAVTVTNWDGHGTPVVGTLLYKADGVKRTVDNIRRDAEKAFVESPLNTKELENWQLDITAKSMKASDFEESVANLEKTGNFIKTRVPSLATRWLITNDVADVNAAGETIILSGDNDDDDDDDDIFVDNDDYEDEDEDEEEASGEALPFSPNVPDSPESREAAISAMAAAAIAMAAAAINEPVLVPPEESSNISPREIENAPPPTNFDTPTYEPASMTETHWAEPSNYDAPSFGE